MTETPAEPEWLVLEAVYQAHDLSLERYGGAAGLRDAGLLESAVSRPVNRFAYEGVTDIAALAATYAVALAKNDPFVDGNKRTAFAALGAFLSRNKMALSTSQDEATRVMYAVAAGEMDVDALTEWVRENSRTLG